MISNPHPGQRVQVWYARHYAAHMPLHGRIGVVRLVGKARPRNHGVEVDGVVYCVPCGNLRRAE